MAKQILLKTGFIVLAVFLLLFFGYLIWTGVYHQGEITTSVLVSLVKENAEKIVKFESEQDFKNYLEKAQDTVTGYYGFGGGMVRADVAVESAVPTMAADELGFAAEEKAVVPTAAPAPERVSETTVQVAGIDEPDIVKTDGKEIYLSQELYQYYPTREPMIMMEKIAPLPPDILNQGGVKAIKAFPPADLGIDSTIQKSGNMLLYEDTLVVFANNNIYAYDVSNPANPTDKWEIEVDENNYIAGTRRYEGDIYLVLSGQINNSKPCPFEPLSVAGNPLTINCTDIYHPVANVPIDITYSILKIDYKTGEVSEKASFVGTSGSSVVYMSPNAVYVTYTYPGDFIKFAYNFFKENTDIMPAWVIDKMEKLMSYDLSDRAKMAEFETIMQQFMNSLSSDEQLRIQNELSNRMGDYMDKHKRELEQTGIVKIEIDNLSITATGSVPGTPLNQFSLDEYEDNLRIATTIGSQWWWGFGSSSQSVSDVYVLNKSLNEKGSVKDLGETERIYSVRFIQDKGYVVTFRQVDPLYVLDLSDPSKPELKGELKIPGYSSYLHPITKDKILGIGEEDNQVKVSLFDVSDPENPQEIAKYKLDDWYSEIAQTHHAFLLDDKHKIFFLPGSRGGYIFSYENDKLSLKKAISDIISRRAIYINDYLYIIGDDKIIVYNETDWTEVNKLEFY